MKKGYCGDTIVALSTPLGNAGIGVIRLSGPKAYQILTQIFSKREKLLSHRVYFGNIISPFDKKLIDNVLAVYMKAPKTYTGEDVVEISCHGGIYIIKKILGLCIKLQTRMAEKGEFTKRAFLNGKIDLPQAESVLGLIKAKTEGSFSSAMEQGQGKLSKEINALREELLLSLAYIEGMIDFPEDINASNKIHKIKKALSKINKMLENADKGKILSNGLLSIIVGPPNVGKSSLLNAFLREERAIVTDIPGTTRDLIEAEVDIKGVLLRIVDTAGLRKAKNRIESLGILKTQQLLEEADVVLLVFDAILGLKKDFLSKIKVLSAEKRNIIVVGNKIDLVRSHKEHKIAGQPVFYVSAKTGQGIKKLEQAIINKVLKKSHRTSDRPAIINERHKACLICAKDRLNRVLGNNIKPDNLELIAIEIKEAIRALGEITGKEVSEEVIEKIFADFCVGK